MSPDELPPLSSPVASLLDAERDAFESPSPEVHADLAKRLASLGPVPAAPASPASPVLRVEALGASTLAKAAALLVAGGIAGSLIATLARPTPVRSEARVVKVEAPSPAPTPQASSIPVPVPEPLPSVSSESPTPLPAAPLPAQSVARGDDRSLARERALIETARSAVIRRDGQAAVAATADHLQQFPNGRLAEEREALAVQGLMLVGRVSEAQARAERFKGRYPNGLFLPIVEAALPK